MNRGDLIVGICYRPPKQEEADETFRHLQKASHLQVLILIITTGHRQSRMFLKLIDDLLLTRLIKELI